MSRTTFALALAVPLSFAGSAVAQAPLEQRVQRLERMVDSSAMIQLLESVKSLQRDVRELRGEIEVQNHTLDQLKRRQRELYADVDQRMQAIESAPPVTAAAPPAAAPGAAPGAPPVPPPGASAPPGGTPETASGAPPIDDVAEQAAYQSAFTLLKDGRYEQAAQGFRDFLGRYPNGRYAGNAQYWLGETFYGMRRYDDAAREFETLLGRYPDSQKQPHAMLKLGYSQAELGRADEARATLSALVERYPDTTAAGLARKRLDRLGG